MFVLAVARYILFVVNEAQSVYAKYFKLRHFLVASLEYFCLCKLSNKFCNQFLYVIHKIICFFMNLIYKPYNCL